ncbi:MobF family relaxase [Cryptosporangium sp. NPDC048952]|uniref:MobF family relaxase n=1 Tax=Cryptosporangium sp. NPDC048952 TaxID=3363961 RepID=UPI0037217799
MTIHKLTVGDGYTYLTRHIAGGDTPRARDQSAGDYYTAAGNPPGRWIGRGVPLLGLDGQQVTEEQMKALFGHGQHPNATAIITSYQDGHLQAGMSDVQVQQVQADARKAATLGLGFPAYKPLAPFADRVRKRLDDVTEQTGRAPTPAEAAKIQREESRRQRAAVAGFDVVFAPVKSAALLWALDGRAWVRDAVRAAHDEAKSAALAMLEEHAAFTRTGTGGIAQIATDGLIAAAFDHYDSRDGDPNLHTHVAIVNKVRGVDGKWRSLDARALYRITVAASERYNTAFQASLTARLGVSWREVKKRGREPVYEIDGIPDAVARHFSQRRAAIETRYDQLLAEYRSAHGHDPPIGVCQRLARQATLDTRHGKKPPRSLPAMRAEWRASVETVFGHSMLSQLATAVPAPSGNGTSAPPDIDALAAELADQVVAAVGEVRSTWTRWNLHAEAERLLRAIGLATDPAVHRALVDAAVDHAVAPERSITVEAPALVDEPAELRRADGESLFVEHAAARYTSTTVLDAEQRLVDAAATITDGALPAVLVDAALTEFSHTHGRPLDAGQQRLVTAFATNPRLLVVGLGAAGTGKTTAMRAYLHTLRAGGQRLVPLATSAAAAAILATELNVPAENLHKFLYEYTNGLCADQLRAGAPVPAAYQQFALRPGDVVLVDEAGMAGTPNLYRLVTLARQRGARVRLLGDYRQLGAVESGGALRLLATEAGAVELSTLHRFTDPAEATATLGLREGRTQSLDFYETHGRIRGGSEQAMLDAVYTGWLTDIRAGAVSLMSAATNADVTALAARARTDRIALGQVEHQGLLLHDGNHAGRGDWVVTRRNNRRLTSHGGHDFVRNGDPWRVLHRHRDGSLTAQHLTHGGRVRLPARYVAEHVELLYATTVHRAQGSTVDTAHALVTPEMGREHLYVAATRARRSTHLYVPTHELLPLDEDERLDRTRYDPRVRAAREVLDTVLGRENAELSATETIRDNQERAASLATLVPRYLYVADLLAERRYKPIIRSLFADQADGLLDDPAWPALVRAVHRAEAAGWQPEQLLAAALTYRPLDDAESLAKVIAWRCERIVKEQHPGAWLIQPTSEQAERYAELVHQATGVRPDRADALLLPHALEAAPVVARPEHYASVPIDHLADYATHAATLLGSESRQIEAHHAWPRLAATLAAARRHGHDPIAMLDDAVRPESKPEDVADLTNAAKQITRRLRLPADEIRIPRALAASDLANRVLGEDIADRVRAETPWPALRSALSRAARIGHDPEQLLRKAAAEPLPLRVQLSQHLAQCILYLTTTAPSPSGGEWRNLAWALAAHEHTGGHAADLLSTELADLTLSNLSRRAQDNAARSRAARTSSDGMLPWIPPVAHHEPDSALTAYLRQARDEITQRVEHIAALARADTPEWLTALGQPPVDYGVCRRWNEALGVVAAYRDQQHVTDDDRAHPLGPYIEEGRAGHGAYWHAAAALVTARQLATTGLSLQPRRPTDPSEVSTAHRIAVDTYLGLDAAGREVIASTMVARLGNLWQGTATDLDAGITQPAYARQLQDTLTQAGHLGKAGPDPARAPSAQESESRRRTIGPHRSAASQRLTRGGQAQPSATPAQLERLRHPTHQQGRQQPRL